MESSQKQFMQLAIELSIKSVENGGGPFGAVIVKQGVVIAACSNSVTKTNDPTAHAEVNAIRAACETLNNFQLDDCEIYTSCEPCPMCLGAIYWARLAKVYYANTKTDAREIGFDDSFIYQELEVPPINRKIPMIQIEREAAQKAFAAWTLKLDKIEY